MSAFSHPCAAGCTCARHEPDALPNDQLREAVLKVIHAPDPLRVSASELAVRAGYVRPGRQGPGDGSRLKRLLGITPTPSTKNGRRYKTYRQNIAYDDAVRIADALGLDPFEVGL